MKIHIAGMSVFVNSKGRQICAWCGHVLFDVDLADVMVAPNADGSPGQGPRPWKQGDLIAIDGSPPVVSYRVVEVEGDELPRECCAAQRTPLRVVPADEGSLA